MPTEKDYKIIEKATIYDLRLLFSSGEKETYTKEEIVELLDGQGPGVTASRGAIPGYCFAPQSLQPPKQAVQPLSCGLPTARKALNSPQVSRGP